MATEKNQHGEAETCLMDVDDTISNDELSVNFFSLDSAPFTGLLTLTTDDQSVVESDEKNGKRFYQIHGRLSALTESSNYHQYSIKFQVEASLEMTECDAFRWLELQGHLHLHQHRQQHQHQRNLSSFHWHQHQVVEHGPLASESSEWKCVSSHQKEWTLKNVSNWLIINNGRDSSTLTSPSTNFTSHTARRFQFSHFIRLFCVLTSATYFSAIVAGCNCLLAFNYRVSTNMLPLSTNEL